MNNIEIRKYTKIEKVKKQWKQLYFEMHEIGPCMSYEFSEFLLKHDKIHLFYRSFHVEFFEILYKTEAGNEKTILILPLKRRKLKNGIQQYNILPEVGGTSRLDAIYDEKIDENIYREAFKQLVAEMILPGAYISFNGIHENSLLYRIRPEDAIIKAKKDSVEILLGTEYQTYYNSLTKNSRQNIRTSYNRMMTDKTSMEVKYYCGEQVPKQIGYMVDELYIKRWTEMEYITQAEYFQEKILQKFKYKNEATKKITEKFEDNYVAVLFINKKPAAMMRCIYNYGCMIVLKFAIATEFSRYSPGIVLINEVAKNIIQQNLTKVLDFSFGVMKYKMEMGGTIYHQFDMDLVKK